MIDAKQVQKQKDGMLMFEAYVLPFLNQFEVLECSASGEELEYVVIRETKENVQKLNEFLCTINCWDMIAPGFYVQLWENFWNIVVLKMQALWI
ncbi:hypothetical protein [Enterococcus faecium]|uniref:hypothetical protein n=1 Tax=Enterococcus faecium TaxID=1352 RepID=UPI001D0FF8DD|nr:hypothetical protein [Enterococcus faecium]